MRTLFLTYLVQGVLLGAAGLVLAVLARVLRRRYGPAWLCRAWLALAILLVLPLRLALPAAAPAPVRLTAPASRRRCWKPRICRPFMARCIPTNTASWFTARLSAKS